MSAELPLAVADLMTDKGEIRLDLSMAYANAARQGVSTGGAILVQTGSSSFVALPTIITNSLGNSDILVGTAGLRYGATPNTELYARISGLSTRHRHSDAFGSSSANDSRFADAWFGVNHHIGEGRRQRCAASFRRGRARREASIQYGKLSIGHAGADGLQGQ